MYLNFSFSAVFLKNRNIISKIKRSKVTDYAALIIWLGVYDKVQDASVKISLDIGKHKFNDTRTSL